jgi:hypothetical protein
MAECVGAGSVSCGCRARECRGSERVQRVGFALLAGGSYILNSDRKQSVDSDLRHWGLKLAERGGKSGKK